jgi:hypothetical protein
MNDQELEAKINKVIEPLDHAISMFKKVIRETWPQEHPDATLMTEAYEQMPVQPNLNDISLPVTKQP